MLDSLVLSDGFRLDDLIDVETREVSLRLLSDPEIYRQELRRIFARVWCVLAMVIQEYFDIGGVIGMTVRGMYAYYVCCWLGGRLSSGGEATSAVCGGSSIIAQ